MTEAELEELIEKMARYIACASSSEDDPYSEWCDENWPAHENEARAALAVAEPVIREQAHKALREENARLLGLLREAHVKMDANNLWSNLRNRVAAAIWEGEKNGKI